MKRLLLFLLIGIIFLTSCKSNENTDNSNLKVYIVSEDDIVEESKVHTFVIGEVESQDQWYFDTKERRKMLREFRNFFEQDKEDFEADKKSKFKNVIAVIDGDLIFGYNEALDLDKTYEESLVEPDVKSDSVYSIQTGRNGGYR